MQTQQLIPGLAALCRGCRHHLPALDWHPTPCGRVHWQATRHAAHQAVARGDGDRSCVPLGGGPQCDLMDLSPPPAMPPRVNGPNSIVRSARSAMRCPLFASGVCSGSFASVVESSVSGWLGGRIIIPRNPGDNEESGGESFSASRC